MEKNFSQRTKSHTSIQYSIEKLSHQRASIRSSPLWEEQCILALFSWAFAALYAVYFHREALVSGSMLQGWNQVVVWMTLTQAAQGILVACAIQWYGIVFRLILGTISVCLCVAIEGLFFSEPFVIQEGLGIVLVLVGSHLYFTTLLRDAHNNSETIVVPMNDRLFEKGKG